MSRAGKKDGMYTADRHSAYLNLYLDGSSSEGSGFGYAHLGALNFGGRSCFLLSRESGIAEPATGRSSKSSILLEGFDSAARTSLA